MPIPIAYPCARNLVGKIFEQWTAAIGANPMEKEITYPIPVTKHVTTAHKGLVLLASMNSRHAPKETSEMTTPPMLLSNSHRCPSRLMK